MNKIAVILVRGLVGVNRDIKETLAYLNIRKKHACVIVDDTPVIRGMLKKAQSYITFGPVSEELLAELITKRGTKSKENKVFFLAPPIGGFEKKGIKQSFVAGGVLGDRKEAINILLKKMI
ncbi:uL30 family ribosomal protein [Candidatus Woesearchaeota archaeon]|nr:uL30 family ribosomal protein [Candidatus Woesearchaeota archaeon]